jgi:RimJ/RimL family protein N-acetyltransferase
MRDSRYRMREFGPTDYEAQAAILNRLTPDRPWTVEQLRFEDDLAHAPPMVCRQLAVEEVSTGRMVAAGGTVTAPDGIGTGSFWVGADVDPDHQRRGIGRDLAERLEPVARELGALRLWASARAEDPRSIRFLAQTGYVEKHRAWQSRLDVATGVARDAELGPLPVPDGVEFTTYAEEGPNDEKVLDRIHALVTVAMADAPRLGRYVPPTRDQVVGMELTGPGFLPEAVFLARSGDRYVGMSNLQRLEAEPDTLRLNLTGTLPEYRHRGVATELKRRGIRFANERGFRVIRTWNNSLNAAMWAINERLGYTREREMVFTEKELPRLPGPGAPSPPGPG